MRKDWTFNVSRDFIRREDVGIAAKGLLLIISSYADKKTLEAWPTKPQLEKDSGLSHNTIDRLLIGLRGAGLIQWSHFRDEYGQMRNKYTLATTQILGAGHHPKSGWVSGTKYQQCRMKKPAVPLKLGIRPPHEEP